MTKQLAQTLKEASEVEDRIARELLAEVFLISLIPDDKPIEVYDLIDRVLDESYNLNAEFQFSFANWAQATVVEVVDHLIVCGIIDGPFVDIDTEGEILLKSSVSKNKETETYIKNTMNEVWEYTPEARGR